MANDEMDAVSELRIVPKFLETAVENVCLEIATLASEDRARPPWADALLKEWERYVRWRAHTTNNPALLENVAHLLDKAAGELREAKAIMGGKPIGSRNVQGEGFDGR
jgi:hypothetical protein